MVELDWISQGRLHQGAAGWVRAESFALTVHISHIFCTVTQELTAARFFSCFFAFYSPMIDSHLGLRSIGPF